MRSMLVMLFVTASMTGCAAQASEGESEGATAEAKGSTASALQKSGGSGTETCPGGGEPACVKCSNHQCVWTCAGGNTCDIDAYSCSVVTNVCRTLSFSPGDFAGKVMF